MKINDKFLYEISRTKNPEYIAAIAKILRVDLIKKEENSEKKPEARSFADVLGDIMKNYNASNRKRRRELYEILKKANKEALNANYTENTTKSEISNEKM